VGACCAPVFALLSLLLAITSTLIWSSSSLIFIREDGFYFSIVIDLSIAMQRVFVISMLVFLLVSQPVRAQEQAQFTISSPLEGEIVQGVAIVTGTVSALGFSSYELSFAYADDPTQTWFVIATSSLPVFEGELGAWDTTTLTDGDYSLRLRTFMLDGTMQEMTVPGLRVRNYTAVPTSTPTPTSTPVVQFAAPTAQRIEPVLATAIPFLPTPTPLPPNPASLQQASILGALGRGALLVFLLFIGLGLLLRLRRE
jgi:hypothetical protein